MSLQRGKQAARHLDCLFLTRSDCSIGAVLLLHHICQSHSPYSFSVSLIQFEDYAINVKEIVFY